MCFIVTFCNLILGMRHELCIWLLTALQDSTAPESINKIKNWEVDLDNLS